MLTQEKIKCQFLYDYITGLLIRKKSKRKVGNVRKDGYRQIKVDGVLYLEHRLIWLYVYGEFPDGEIDHIDHNRLNNKISNLRCVGKSGNQQNKIKARKDNKTTGTLGVTRIPTTGKYRARIHVDGKEKHLGVFDTLESASNAYIEAKRKYHSTCTI